jgi:hypothetical protein
MIRGMTAATQLTPPQAPPATSALGTVMSSSSGRRWRWPAGFALASAILFICYFRLAHFTAVNSDAASNALQAWAMLHGNVLLSGWTLTDVSFYTTELPEYVLIELLRGLTPGVVHVAAALTYTLVVLGSALVAKGSAGGREGLVRALIAGGILFAPTVSTNTMLQWGPDHLGTQVPLLLLWLILDRARRCWLVPVLVTVLLAVTQVADQLVTFEAAVPLALVSCLRVYRYRGRLAESLPDCWFDLSLAAGAIASTAMAALALRLIGEAGGYRMSPTDNIMGTVSDLYTHS